MTTLDPVLVAAIRETADWMADDSYAAARAAAVDRWDAFTQYDRSYTVASAVLDRLLSGAE